MVLSNATFLLICVLIGFLHAPFWIFFAALLVLNIILYHTNKTRPMRYDYNLFLRQAKGLLGTSGELSTEPAEITRTEMRDFVRFLGERFLVRDYSIDNDGLVLQLPPVKPGMAQFLGLTGSNSRLCIGFDGQCEAHLGNKDLRNLHRLAEGASVERRVLEDEVAVIAKNALRLFLDGRFDQAESLLEAETDRNIFVKPTPQAKEHRIRGGIAIVAALLFLIISLWASRDGDWSDWRPPRPVSRAMAREAIAEWSRQYPLERDSIMSLMGGERLPSLDFIGVENRDAYKDVVVQYLTEWDEGHLPSRIIHNLLSHPKALYNIIENRILTKEELADLGFSTEKVREVLESHGKEKMQRMMELSHIEKVGDNASYKMSDVNKNAYRLACLKEFGCLDFVDADRIAEEIATKQITLNWEIPSGYEQINTEQGAGLFHFGFCDLRGTRGALWTLQILDRLDLIDREACLDAILRFYRRKGIFRADREDNIDIYGKEEDTFYAMESLVILNGFDRVKDFDRWKFKPKTSTRTQNRKKERGIVTPRSAISWAYQLRLEEIRGN